MNILNPITSCINGEIAVLELTLNPFPPRPRPAPPRHTVQIVKLNKVSYKNFSKEWEEEEVEECISFHRVQEEAEMKLTLNNAINIVL